MEENKKETGIKGFWNRHKGKVKVAATAVAAFTVGVLLAKPNKEDQMLLNHVHTWGPSAETKRSFGQNFILAECGSKQCDIFGTDELAYNTISGALDYAKNFYSERGKNPDETEATGMIIFTK